VILDDASSQYLQTDAAPVTGPPFSLSIWFKSDDEVAANQTIWWCGDKDVPQHYYSFRYKPVTQNLVWDAFAAAVHGKAILSPISAGTWHHALGVAAASNSRTLYSGGSKKTNTNDVSPAGVDRVALGRMADSSPIRYWSGNLAWACMWNIALTEADANNLALGWHPFLVERDNIVAFWPLGGQYGDNANDVVGSYDLTEFNSPTWQAQPSDLIQQSNNTPGFIGIL